MKKIILLFLSFVFLLTTYAFADQSFGVWSLKAYVDEFDMPTDNYYVVASVTGHFSNSATTNSDLDAIIFFNNWADTKTAYVEIRLFEYGRSRVSNYSSKNNEHYDVLVMDTEGNKTTLTGYLRPKDTDMRFNDNDNAKLVRILSAKSGTVRFAITERDNKLTKYVFAIQDVAGLADACTAGGLNMNP